jgi:hypothetical protein
MMVKGGGFLLNGFTKWKRLGGVSQNVLDEGILEVLVCIIILIYFASTVGSFLAS